MNAKKRIAAVVVARDRADTVRTTLDAITTQVPGPDALVLVANDATPAVVDVLRSVAASHPDCQVIELPQNTGAAGGFHAGLAAVIARDDLDLACCFDDDAVPQPGCLAALEAELARRSDAGSVGALSHDGAGRLAWELHVEGEPGPSETVEEVRALSARRDGLPVAAMCWHGLMVPADVLRRHGNVRADFFLQYEDAEFGRRLRRAGLQNYLAPDAEVHHPRRPPAREVRLLGRTVRITHESPAKEYLTLRNELVVHAHYGGLRFWTLTGPLILVRGLLTAWSMDVSKPAALRHVFLRAIVDAARGRLGPPPPRTAGLR